MLVIGGISLGEFSGSLSNKDDKLSDKKRDVDVDE